jgi:hypothetical protein
VKTHVERRDLRPIASHGIEAFVQVRLFNLEYLSVEERIQKKGPAGAGWPGDK